LSFIQLHGKKDHEIVRFARHWGPLGICEHGQPYTHRPKCTPLNYMHRDWESVDEAAIWHMADITVATERRTWRRFWEPLSAWRFYSSQFSALLRTARALAEGSIPSFPDSVAAFRWQDFVEYDALVAGKPYPPRDGHADWTEQNVQHLTAVNVGEEAATLDYWMTCLARDARLTWIQHRAPGEARPHWAVSYGQAPASSPWSDELHLHTDSLFAVLTAQLSAMVQNPTRIYECSVCENLVTKKRRPNPDHRILCSSLECQTLAQQEDKRKWATKNRERARAERERDHESEPGPDSAQ
jgi:hypothetical protein